MKIPILFKEYIRLIETRYFKREFVYSGFF